MTTATANRLAPGDRCILDAAELVYHRLTGGYLILTVDSIRSIGDGDVRGLHAWLEKAGLDADVLSAVGGWKRTTGDLEVLLRLHRWLGAHSYPGAPTS
ncbi:MAG TPA: hypothetical protein VEL07_18610 [Planctomycetota bacterium]|nr:hypothetical protein [Planctomycetota bacterium]